MIEHKYSWANKNHPNPTNQTIRIQLPAQKAGNLKEYFEAFDYQNKDVLNYLIDYQGKLDMLQEAIMHEIVMLDKKV